MRRRTIAFGLVTIIALVVGSLGTFKARQVLAESSAHSAMVLARANLEKGLHHSLTVGLYPSEIAVFERRLASIDARPAPADSSLWETTLATFFDRQTKAYRALKLQVRANLHRVLALTRAQAMQAITHTQGVVQQEQTLDLDASALQAVLARAQTAYRDAHLPRQFRGLVTSLSGATAAAGTAVQARQRFVNGVLASTNSSLPAIVQRANAEIDDARNQVSLMSLLSPKAARYTHILDQLGAGVDGQKTALAAAGKLASLEDEITALTAEFNRTIPGQMIVVSTEDQSAQLYQNGKVIYTTPVTTGGPELPTDHGVFHIYEKISPFVFHSPWPPSSPYYYLPSPVTYWMPFDGGEGLHDAPWRSNFGPGSNLEPTDLGTGNYILGTHGCVNLPYDAAQYIWNWAPVGTTVVVI